MKLKNTIKNIGTALLIGTASMAPVKAGNSVECLIGDKSTFADVQVNADLTKRLTLFSQGKFRTTYDNKVSGYSEFDLYCYLAKGFQSTIETQANTGSKVVPRAGFSYFKKLGNFGMFYQTTASLQKNTDFDIWGVFSYSKPITDKINFAACSKNLGNVGSNGLNYFVSMERLGLNINGYTFGPVCDITVDKNYKPSFNTGVSVKKTF